MRWDDLALCRGSRIELWFPPAGHAGRLATATARAVCQQCPVMAQCLDAALAEEGAAPRHMRFGVRGGQGPRQRYDTAVALSYLPIRRRPRRRPRRGSHPSPR